MWEYVDRGGRTNGENVWKYRGDGIMVFSVRIEA